MNILQKAREVGHTQQARGWIRCSERVLDDRKDKLWRCGQYGLMKRKGIPGRLDGVIGSRPGSDLVPNNQPFEDDESQTEARCSAPS